MPLGQSPRTDSIVSGDLFYIWKAQDSQPQLAALQTVATAIQPLLTVPGSYVSQYINPSATGFTATMNNTANDARLILTPGGAYANGTIVLPSGGSTGVAVDHQRLLITCTQAVTTLAITLNGATAAIGAPTTLAANAFFMLMYDVITTSWYRVG
jgi:hypothetical protein